MKSRAIHYLSVSALATQGLAKKIAAALEPGTVLALVGELGSGKTTFVKGLAQGLGIKDLITSPSFVLVKEYRGKMPLFHFDFYRLQRAAALDQPGFDEYLDKKGVVVLEWADRLPQVLPEHYLKLTFKWLSPVKRAIIISGHNLPEQGIIKALKKVMPDKRRKK